jgi:hypothetical protein
LTIVGADDLAEVNHWVASLKLDDMYEASLKK